MGKGGGERKRAPLQKSRVHQLGTGGCQQRRGILPLTIQRGEGDGECTLAGSILAKRKEKTLQGFLLSSRARMKRRRIASATPSFHVRALWTFNLAKASLVRRRRGNGAPHLAAALCFLRGDFIRGNFDVSGCRLFAAVLGGAEEFQRARRRPGKSPVFGCAGALLRQAL